MKMKMLRSTVIDGRVCYAGEIVEVPEANSRMLIHQGKAEPYASMKPAETAAIEPSENEKAPDAKRRTAK